MSFSLNPNITFSKYHGTGNDFILIDNRNLQFKKEQSFIADLCHLRFGIGADRLILLEKSKNKDIDFDMVYFNANGAQSTMCGNGGRCIVKFAQALNLIDKEALFSAVDGLHQAKLNDNLVSLKMMDVHQFKEKENIFIVDTGSPHYIGFVDDIAKINIQTECRKIRHSAPFKKKGINVNFVEIGKSQHKIRTYERGVEAETYSCGTGAVAAAIALVKSENGTSLLLFETRGGNLQVHLTQEPENEFSDIWLTGSVVKVFEGTLKNKNI